MRDELMPDMAREIPVDPLGLARETVAGWVFPYYVRADILALQGWRRTLFGDAALKLKRGELALTLVDGEVRAVPAARPL